MSWLWGTKKEVQLLAEKKDDISRTTFDDRGRELLSAGGGGKSNDELSSRRHDDTSPVEDIDTRDRDNSAKRVEQKDTLIKDGTSLDDSEVNVDHDNDRDVYDSTHEEDNDDDSDDESVDDDDDDGDEDHGRHTRQTPKSFDSGTTGDEDDTSTMEQDSTDVDSINDDFLDSSSNDDDEESPSPVHNESDDNAIDDDNDDDDDDDDDDETGQNTSRKNHCVKMTQAQSSLGSDKDHSGPEVEVERMKDAEQQKKKKKKKDTAKKEPEDDDEEQNPTSFWEKQSLLMLAAEHDRVDILKSILTEDDDDKEKLMNGGIPPLHLAIAFGSVNTTQSLLRMGADPSVRPNVDEIVEQKRDQPKDSKVEIANIRRFHEVSAWELAFGNKNYESLPKNGKSWSLFGSSPSSLSAAQERTSENGGSDNDSSTRVIKPVDMAPSKREGVRHAFTAEALRCVGSDEAGRLEQLVNSGMPATIDIGGKDLYSWAVEMGALQCEEFLRPSEAAKYGGVGASSVSAPQDPTDNNPPGESDVNGNANIPSFVIHRPADETVPQLLNRLDELESLSVALSTCLDNLAEEVSVCHGLLILGGGASALASHVRSLKALQVQKWDQLDEAQAANETLEDELANLLRSAGEVGKEIDNLPSFNSFNPAMPVFFSDDKRKEEKNSAETNAPDSEAARKNLTAQIAASENKVRKLRASIADLSEENARDMKEVLRRGLEGGINLVRGLREELRDIDFQLDGARIMKLTFRRKMSMIHARIPTLRSSPSQTESDEQEATDAEVVSENEGDSKPNGFIEERKDLSDVAEDKQASIAMHARATGDNKGNSIDTAQSTTNGSANRKSTPDISRAEMDLEDENHTMEHQARPQSSLDQPQSIEAAANADQKNLTQLERIATGKSQAIAVVAPGNRGYFTVDLWQVLLRIIGYERESYRRGLQVANNQPHVMIV